MCLSEIKETVWFNSRHVKFSHLTDLVKIYLSVETGIAPSLTTVFVDTRLWRTKHPRKRFQNFRQSCALLTDRIEIHQFQPLV